jgi:RNA recognition motif-containing protein
MSVRLYVGNLPTELDRQALEQLFQDSGVLKVINDRKTGKCRGFAFITVENEEQAGAVIEKFNGFDFNGNPLKLEVALPRNKDAKGEGKAEEADQDSTPKPVRAVPKPALRANRSRAEALADIKLASDLPAPSPEEATEPVQDSAVSVPKEKSESGKRRNKSRKQSNNKAQQSSFSYADTADQHQPDPRWAHELAQLRQRLLDAQAVK